MTEPAILPTDAPPLEQCGFIRVPRAEGDAGPPHWLRCNTCQKSDHFWIAADELRCRCGARYGFGVRPDGFNVPVRDLQFVPFNKGPMQLADLEWDPVRLTVAGLVLVALVAGGVAWWMWGTA